MATITRIDSPSIHRICSGQVILDCASAVKELVENSLDAGATNIEVRFKSYGTEGIEVVDNGHGINPLDYEMLAQKHATSKLSSFSDLLNVRTFGFRGEALSSLCAVSDLVVITCTADSPVGNRLTFDHDGRLTERVPSPRERGTTISINHLFESYPVRRQTFMKNAKKDYAKSVSILQTYALSNHHVKITCVSLTRDAANYKRQLVFSSPASSSMNDAIALLFGVKQLESLIPYFADFKSVIPNQGMPRDTDTTDNIVDKSSIKYTISGFLSKPGTGRSSPDRQFVFINHRPCDLPLFTRVVNEVYSQYHLLTAISAQQYPVILLNIQFPPFSYDVNVTPDKRTIYLHHESTIYSFLRESLIQHYEPFRSSFQIHPTLKYSPSYSSQTHPPSNSSSQIQSSIDFQAVPMKEIENSSVSGCDDKHGTDDHESGSVEYSQLSEDQPPSEAAVMIPRINKSTRDVIHCDTHCDKVSHLRESTLLSKFNLHSTQNSTHSSSTVVQDDVSLDRNVDSDEEQVLDDNRQEVLDRSAKKLKSTPLETPQLPKLKSIPLFLSLTAGESMSVDDVCIHKFVEHVATRKSATDQDFSSSDSTADKQTPLFQASFTDSSADTELRRVFDQQNFDKMRILGQFNLGFIIAHLTDSHLSTSDLFIIDQHASDEKYNFEYLMKHTRLNCQPLVHPLPLSLSPAEESVLLDHLDVFSRHGFQLRARMDMPAGQRIEIIAQPYSHSVQFNANDAYELISKFLDIPKDHSEQLNDHNTSDCRVKLESENATTQVEPWTLLDFQCSKVYHMLASRACRQSVMIGDPLNQRQMRKIVKRLAMLRQPWNCPHGRPTMRHLLDMNQWTLTARHEQMKKCGWLVSTAKHEIENNGDAEREEEEEEEEEEDCFLPLNERIDPFCSVMLEMYVN